ncbi:sirohydrochlorin chelatase [Neobacillus niacini]|uniref:sirohydrochlorin chelatase n=1 Tax=Neobacillus niacini TaxID=86668 RepID=UPI002859BBCC|nr:sirohydrochlorin chelatase [Neobacillus niacini]MDR7002802.1 sirohydrochlorin ferrochelatase [Neobacillus niacini]
MKAILYIGHGTRSKKGTEEVKSFLNRVIERVNVPIQEISFLELTDPSIEVGFRRCVEKGASEINVVPIFLLAAGHIKEDIPNALSVLGKQYPEVQVKVRNPFGVQDQILDAIAELIRGAAGEVTSQDSLLIVGRGSSDPSIHHSFARIANGIHERLQTDYVSVCYLAAAEPRLQEGIEAILEAGSGRIIVIPYLLFSGLLLTEINQMIRKKQTEDREIICTGQLSQHRVIEDIVVRGFDKIR